MSTGLIHTQSISRPCHTGQRTTSAFEVAVCTQFVAVACVTAYILRTSLLPYVFPSHFSGLLTQATIATLILATVIVSLAGLGRINRWGILLIAATSLSLWNCDRFDFAMPRWLGWVALFWTLGPANSTTLGRQLRRQMLHAMTIAFTLVTVLSAMWWLFGLPNLGRGDFTGVMWHSMVLGPVAAFTGIVAIVRGIQQRAAIWFFLYGLSAMVTMLASSRAALAAMAAGTLTIFLLKLNKYPWVTFGVLGMMVVTVMIPAASVDLVVSLLPNEVTAGLTQKSWNNSREMHWQARWDEFLSSPFTGVGFATAWEDTIGVDDETGAVETGSSYLAMLSMTGYVGGVACLLLALSLAMRLLACWPILTERQRLEIGSSASFWLVHLGAEGYIYAVASLLGLTFWLWLGCLNDELHAVTALRDTRKFCGLTSAPRWTANPGRVIL